MSSKLKFLVSSRGNYRGQVNTIFNEISNFRNKPSSDRIVLKTKVDKLQNELNKLDSHIQELKWEENEDDEMKARAENEKEMREASLYTDKIYDILGKLEELSFSSQSSNSLNTMLKSPNAPLPTYSSKEEENLIKFFNQFEETTKRFAYSDYDLFLLLKQQVSGKGSSLLNALDVSEHSYPIAKALLIEALASTETQKFNVIKQMSNLRLDYSSEPFEYIGQINSIHESMKSLSITSDDILQYFCWTGMNETFKTQMIQVTAKTKPNLSLIKSKFFETCERYGNLQTKYKKRNFEASSKPINKHVAGLANNIEFQKNASQNIFKMCTLCSDFNHPVFKCPSFTDAKSKVERLHKLNGCINCAKLNHQSNHCKFHFHKRCICGKWHFNFLCVSPTQRSEQKGSPKIEKTKKQEKRAKSVKEEEEQETTNEEQTTSGLINIENFYINCGKEAILPTFSATLSGDVEMRILRDSGCQSNFILESLANKLKLPVVKHIELTVNGFNTTKIYNTRIVKVNLNIGGRIYNLLAICTPSINTNLNLPGLSEVAKAFIEKGYALADNHLTDDCINNISFILGTNSSYCLKESQVTFGNELEDTEPSTFSLTPAGAMLMGNVKFMLKNIKYLPRFNNLGVAVMDSNINEYKDFAPIRMNSLDDKPMDGNSHYEINNFLLSHEKDIKVNRTIKISLDVSQSEIMIYTGNKKIKNKKIKK